MRHPIRPARRAASSAARRPTRAAAVTQRARPVARADRIDTGAKTGFRPAGSADLPDSFTNPDDVNGRTIDGAQGGALHRS